MIKHNIRRTGAAIGLLLTIAVAAEAQAPADAYRNALEEISGTARAQSMSGAVGALGADPTAILVNPAGSGLYRRGMLSLGIQRSNSISEVNWRYMNDATNTKADYNLYDFNNFSYISSPILFGGVRGTDWNLNFGIQYNNDFNYTRHYTMTQVTPPSNLSAYIANRANQGTATPNDYYVRRKPNGEIEYNPLFEPLDPIVVMGMNSELVEGSQTENDAIYNPNTWVRGANNEKIFLLPDASSLDVIEKGGKSTFDINVGVGYMDRFYFGASIRRTSMSYSRNSSYNEDYTDDPSNTKMAVAYNNELRTNGSILGLNLGALMAVGDYGRIGVSYLLPQYGTMEDNYYVSSSLYLDNAKGRQNYAFDSGNEYLTSRYNTILPGKLTVSAMAFLSRYGMVTYDLQYRNLGNSRINIGNRGSGVNQFIKEDLGSQLSHRIGLELRPFRSIALRGGYSYTTSGLKAPGLRETNPEGTTYEYIPSGTIVDYVLPDNYQTYSAGIGFRLGKSITADLAWLHGVRSERVFAHPGLNPITNDHGTFPEVRSVGGTLKNVEDRFVGTLSFSF